MTGAPIVEVDAIDVAIGDRFAHLIGFVEGLKGHADAEREALKATLAEAKAASETERAALQAAIDAKLGVELRTCGECKAEYPELVAAPGTICYSCRWIGAQAGDSGLTIDRSLRHDTPDEVGIAALCHEAVRSFAQLQGDPTLPAWADAPAWMVASAIEQARAVLAGMKVAPDVLHEQWRNARTTEGWRYGPVLNPIDRIHPNLVAWPQLSEIEQTKVRLAVAIIGVLVE